MLEREMEDLIAEYPHEFFPRHRLILQGRQKSFREVGRFDLLFSDEFGTQILMELKAVTAKYEDATQLARYRDVLLANGAPNTLMWLVAPSIPRSVREFLDPIGIEYTEIHEPEFRNIAARHGYSFESETAKKKDSNQGLSPAPTPRLDVQPTAEAHEHEQGWAGDWFFNTDEAEIPGAYLKMLDQSCIALWGVHYRAEQLLAKPQTGERVFLYLNQVGVIGSGLFTNDPPVPSDSIFGKQQEGEFRRSVFNLVSISNEHALKPSELRQMGFSVPRTAWLKIYKPLVAKQMLKVLEARANKR